MALDMDHDSIHYPELPGKDLEFGLIGLDGEPTGAILRDPDNNDAWLETEDIHGFRILGAML